MMLDYLLSSKDPLRPAGCLDVLPYYSCVAEGLSGFLGKREIATRIWIPGGPKLLKRGSLLEPLTAAELSANVDRGFAEERAAAKSLAEAAQAITPARKKIWQYVFPRKLCDLFYATNSEGAGRPMDRIFFDIDRPAGMPLWDAARVASSLLGLISGDDQFASLAGRFESFLMYTGSSFHIYVLLGKPIGQRFYDDNVQFSKGRPLASFTGRWTERIRSETGVNAIGGHEKMPGAISIDPSQTPSGKLARCPFSLHMKDAKTVDGVAVPVHPEALKSRSGLEELTSLTPRKVLEGLGSLTGMLPKAR